MKSNGVKWIATVGGVGYLPYAPGTAGSAVALLLILIVRLQPAGYFFLLVLSTVLGCMTAGRYEKLCDKKDPGEVVIDEVSGMFFAAWGLTFSLPVIFTAFILFRIFDSIKLPIFRRIERLPGSWGIMLDDIVIGLSVNVIIRIILFLL